MSIFGADHTTEAEIRAEGYRRLGSLAEELVQALVDAESSARCMAAPYQRSAGRVAVRQGSYRRSIRTRFGIIGLRLPRLGDNRSASLPDAPAIEGAVLQLAAGISTWSAVQDLVSPMRRCHGEADWITTAGRRLLAMADTSRSSALPVSADRIGAFRIRGDDPRIDRLSVAGIAVETDGVVVPWFAKVDPTSTGPWHRVLARARERGLLEVSAIASWSDPGFASAVAQVWPESRTIPIPA